MVREETGLTVKAGRLLKVHSGFQYRIEIHYEAALIADLDNLFLDPRKSSKPVSSAATTCRPECQKPTGNEPRFSDRAGEAWRLAVAGPGGTLLPGCCQASLVDSQMPDVSLHERRRARLMEDPESRAAYEQAAREIAQTDAVIRALDALRVDLGVSKAELARRVNRNASSVRWLFTASRVRPELPLIAPLADVLGAELRVGPPHPTGPACRRGTPPSAACRN